MDLDRKVSISVENATIETDAFQECDKLTTLFLSNCTEEDFKEDTYKNYLGISWTTIHYGYKGSGDYLDENNYSGHWTKQ